MAEQMTDSIPPDQGAVTLLLKRVAAGDRDALDALDALFSSHWCHADTQGNFLSVTIQRLTGAGCDKILFLSEAQCAVHGRVSRWRFVCSSREGGGVHALRRQQVH